MSVRQVELFLRTCILRKLSEKTSNRLRCLYKVGLSMPRWICLRIRYYISEDANATTIVCAWAPRTIGVEKYKNDECEVISIWDVCAHVKIKECVETLSINLWD